jgi:hypothetical protein
MDELKKYVQSHAGELDLDEPRPQVWQQIRQEIGTTKKASVLMMVSRWVAAACLLVLAGIGAWFVLGDQKTKIIPAETIAKTENRPQKPNTIPAPVMEQSVIMKKKPVLVSKTGASVKKRQIDQQPMGKPDLRALNEIESSFTQVINLQRARVSAMPMYAEAPEYFNDFKIQIRQMEKDERVIKSDLSKRGMKDELLDQLINLYQQKLNILKQLQIEMNKANNRFKQNRGPVDSTRTYFLNL